MAITLTPQSSEGTNLYNSTVTYIPASTLTIPAGTTNIQISVSFYVGYNAYYNGDRSYGFEIVLRDAEGYSYTKSEDTWPDSNRGYVEETFTIGPYLNASSVSSVTLRQTDRYSSSYYATVRNSNSSINLDSYDTYRTNCGAPASVYFDNTSVTSKSVAPNKSVTLNWSAGSAGVNTSVSQYQVYRSTNGGAYSLLATVSGRSTSVTSGSNGTVYRYKIVTVSSPSGYNSGQSSAVATLTSAISAPSVPSNVRLDSTYLSSGAQTTLRWDASSAGTNNAVSSYTVYIDGVAQQAVGTTSYTVTAASSGTRSFTVQCNGANGVNSSQSSAVTLYTYSAPSAPTTVKVSPTSVAPGGAATLSWSGANDGSYNTISGYVVHRSTNAASGYSQLGSQLPASTTSLTVYAPESQGSTYYYVVYAVGTRGGTSAVSPYASLTSYSYTAVGAPTGLSISPGIVTPGGSATLSWQAGKAGTNTSISSYWVYSSTDGSTYSKLTGGQTTGLSLSVTAPSSGSIYFKVQSVANLSGYDSALSTEYAVLSVNRSPNAPSSVSASPTLYETGNVTVTWVAGGDPEGQAVTYEVQYKVSTSNSWAAFASGSSTTAEGSIVDSFPRGATATFRVRAIDSLGATSSWVESNSISRNEAPASNVLTFVKASGTGTTYARRPKILLTIGGSEAVSVYATGYTASRSGMIPAGTQVEFVANSDQTDGAKIVTFTVTDAPGASTTVDYNFTVETPIFTDDPIISRTTNVKAVHISELRSQIDVIRSYYGLSSYNWSTVMVARSSKISNWLTEIREIRTAMTEVINQINEWDYSSTTGNLDLPSWISVTTCCPRADVMNELRNILRTL